MWRIRCFEDLELSNKGQRGIVENNEAWTITMQYFAKNKMVVQVATEWIENGCWWRRGSIIVFDDITTFDLDRVGCDLTGVLLLYPFDVRLLVWPRRFFFRVCRRSSFLHLLLLDRRQWREETERGARKCTGGLVFSFSVLVGGLRVCSRRRSRMTLPPMRRY